MLLLLVSVLIVITQANVRGPNTALVERFTNGSSLYANGTLIYEKDILDPARPNAYFAVAGMRVWKEGWVEFSVLLTGKNVCPFPKEKDACLNGAYTDYLFEGRRVIGMIYDTEEIMNNWGMEPYCGSETGFECP